MLCNFRGSSIFIGIQALITFRYRMNIFSAYLTVENIMELAAALIVAENTSAENINRIVISRLKNLHELIHADRSQNVLWNSRGRFCCLICMHLSCFILALVLGDFYREPISAQL